MSLTKITTGVIGDEFTTSQTLSPTGTKDVQIYSTFTSLNTSYFLGTNSGAPGLIEVQYQPDDLIPSDTSLVGKYLKILGTSNIGSIVPGTYEITYNNTIISGLGEVGIILGNNQQQENGGSIDPPINLEFYERFPVYDVDWTAAQIFTLTPSQSTILNVTNPVIGVQKTVIITGSGSSYTITLNVGGAAGTFNLISGEYDDTAGVKNLFSILSVSATEFWYSISQIAV
jgi:hypothetical protein